MARSDGLEVTIVVTPRERFGLSRASLESLYANTTVPFRLVYVDGNAPRHVQTYLREASRSYGFDLVESPTYLSPNRARNVGMQRVDTPFVVFVDNDLVVTKGWLSRLLDCARETGAVAVGPLYLEGNPAERIIHMAGGDYQFGDQTSLRSFSTNHRWQGERLDDHETDLIREPVDFVEFHCMLVRTEFVQRIGGLDESLLSSREHLDLCLLAAHHGEQVYVEPTSEVTYLTPPPIDRVDLPYFLRRWSERWNEASLAHFCDKHDIVPSYADRLVGMRARRQLVLRPLTTLSAKVLPSSLDQLVTRIAARLEREINRAVFRLPDYAQRR